MKNDFKLYIQSLKESNDFLNNLYDNVNSAIFIADQEPRIYHFNDAFKTLFHKASDELLNQLCGNAMGCIFHISKDKDCGETSNCNNCILRKSIIKSFTDKVPVFKESLARQFFINGNYIEKYFIFTTKFISYENKDLILVIVDDVTELEEQKRTIYWQSQEIIRRNKNLEKLINENTFELINLNKTLSKEMKNKKVLLRENFHRVANNLQIINSLINLQSMDINDKEIKLSLKETQSRINTLKILHSGIFNPDFSDEINVKNFFNALIKDIIKTSSQKNNIYFETNTDILNIETTLPLGLVFNEILSLLIKNNTNNEKIKDIKINMTFDKNSDYKLIFKYDDNISLEYFENDKSKFSMAFLNALIYQINGNILINHGDFLEINIKFKEIITKPLVI